ncbi:MAG: hypothetical protein AAF230_04485 [Pseudomonadota bacterium]
MPEFLSSAGPYLPFLLFLLGVLFVFGLPKRKKTYYGQTMDAPAPEPPKLVHETDLGKPEEPEELTLGKRVAAIAFLSFWLTGWTAGCYFALITAAELSYGDEGYIFIRIWLALAIPAWFFVAWTLFRLFRGDNVEISFDGDGGGDGGGD